MLHKTSYGDRNRRPKVRLEHTLIRTYIAKEGGGLVADRDSSVNEEKSAVACFVCRIVDV